MNQEDQDRLERLRPIDDDFFKIYARPKEVVKEIVDAVLMKDTVITHHETQANMKNLSGRSVEFDLYALTEDDIHINIEIEKTKGRATPKRARLHSTSLTSNITYANQPYEKLQDTYVVFMSENNVLDEEAFIQNVKKTINGYGEYNDGDHIMYVNCQRFDDSPLGRIAHDMLCSNPEDMYNPVLRERARYYKNTKEGVREMCAIWDEVRDEGRIERDYEIAKRLSAKGFSVIDIMEITDLSKEEIIKIQYSI